MPFDPKGILLAFSSKSAYTSIPLFLASSFSLSQKASLNHLIIRPLKNVIPSAWDCLSITCGFTLIAISFGGVTSLFIFTICCQKEPPKTATSPSSTTPKPALPSCTSPPPMTTTVLLPSPLSFAVTFPITLPGS